MKNNFLKIVVVTSLLVSLMFGSSSCKKPAEGAMTIRMTDAPADYLAVNIDVEGLEATESNGTKFNLQVKTGIYNLLTLQNNINVVLADNVKIPLDEVTQIRLILGDKNSLVTAGGTFDLKVPSGAESGLKIDVNQYLMSSMTVEVLLDFDANASIVSEGNGGFLLKPVIKVKSVAIF